MESLDFVKNELSKKKFVEGIKKEYEKIDIWFSDSDLIRNINNRFTHIYKQENYDVELPEIKADTYKEYCEIADKIISDSGFSKWEYRLRQILSNKSIPILHFTKEKSYYDFWKRHTIAEIKEILKGRLFLSLHNGEGIAEIITLINHFGKKNNKYKGDVFDISKIPYKKYNYCVWNDYRNECLEYLNNNSVGLSFNLTKDYIEIKGSDKFKDYILPIMFETLEKRINNN